MSSVPLYHPGPTLHFSYIAGHSSGVHRIVPYGFQIKAKANTETEPGLSLDSRQSISKVAWMTAPFIQCAAS